MLDPFYWEVHMFWWVLSLLETVVFIGVFSIAFYLLLPKAMTSWNLWQKTGKLIHLSNAGACASGCFFLVSALFVRFIQAAFLPTFR